MRQLEDGERALVARPDDARERNAAVVRDAKLGVSGNPPAHMDQRRITARHPAEAALDERVDLPLVLDGEDAKADPSKGLTEPGRGRLIAARAHGMSGQEARRDNDSELHDRRDCNPH